MIESKDDYRYYVEQDRKALGYGERRGFAGRMRQLLLPDPIRRFERRLRRCEYLLNVKGRGVRYYLALIAFERLSRKLGFYIPLNVFGPGLSIPHYGTIIVNPPPGSAKTAGCTPASTSAPATAAMRPRKSATTCISGRAPSFSARSPSPTT